MKRVLASIFGAVFGIYFMLSTVIFVPYFNWTYARDNGFVRWLLLGEVVSTAKAFVWPVFLLRGPDSVSGPRSEPERHYTNSKKACDEALRIVVARGDVVRLTATESAEVIKLLRLAISEAQRVDLAYLQKVHQDFPTRYTQEYIKGLQLLAYGLERTDTALALAGTYGYNQFADWMDQNRNDLQW